MYKIDGKNATEDGQFREYDPSTGAGATYITADWLNTLQGELIAILEAQGIEPSKASNAQVLAALDGRFASQSDLAATGGAALVGYQGGTVSDALADLAQGLLNGLSGGAPVYADTAAGLAATSEDGYFNVPSPDPNEIYIVYRHDSGQVANEIGRSPSRKYVDKAAEPVFFYNGSPVDRKGALESGLISRHDGSEQPSDQWNRTEFIPLPERAVVSRIGLTVPANTSNAAGVAFYDNNQNFLGYSADGTGEFIEAESDFPGAKFVRASFASTDPVKEVSVDSQILSEAVHGVKKAVEFFDNSVQDVSKDWLAEPAGNGYINLSGEVVALENWVYSPFIPLIQNATYLYSGRGNTAVVANVASYDENKTFLAVEYLTNLSVDNKEITITTPGAKYLRVSSQKAIEHAFIVDAQMIAGESVIGFNALREKVDELPTAAPPAMVPSYVYGLEGESIYLYTRGIVADRTVDIAWNKPEGNNEFLKLTPTVSETAVGITGIQNGSRLEIASIPVRCSSSPISPAAPLNFICLGDSLTDGNAHSDIDGCYPNELSRRLTGVGTDILGDGPVPLNLSNIIFRGTRGDQPVKHEGRGGWTASSYLNIGSPTNAFWNPATEEFDIDYYLEQNGFRDADVANGVTPTGDNLVMVILLGWNDVYNTDAATSAGYLRQLIDVILSKKPNARFIIPSLQPAPYTNLKTFSGVRYVSESEVFRAIREFALEYQAAISDVIGAEFVHMNHVFNAGAGYQTATSQIAARGSQTVTVAPDHVHPNATGYAMIADALYYNILWRFCQ